jgi:hypothetical protein
VTEAEIAFKKASGLEALEERFEEARFDHLDPFRGVGRLNQRARTSRPGSMSDGDLAPSELDEGTGRRRKPSAKRRFPHSGMERPPPGC